MKVKATETGVYGGALRYRGVEFEIPSKEHLASWMVPAEAELPPESKLPFVRTKKDLMAQANPKDTLNTLSGQARRESLANEARQAGKSEDPLAGKSAVPPKKGA